MKNLWLDSRAKYNRYIETFSLHNVSIFMQGKLYVVKFIFIFDSFSF